ncbi:MAG: tetratricopeptide repeat protein [Gammaproteobacteria bacterium]|nr:tetratricopeptide repeat protein [Gammaproteobacteria bacterium]
MEDYLTEEERVEALKRWWKENARSVLFGVGFGALIVAGWNVWQSRQQQTAEQASAMFQQLLKADDDKQPDAALKLSERLIEQFPSTSYALYGRLFGAKYKAERGDLAGARDLLLTILANSKDDNVRALARLRAGQVMAALNQEEDALKLIEAPDAKVPSTYQALYAELKGDLLLALTRTEEARTAYLQAKQLGQPSPVLELKLQDLAAPKS